MAEKLERASTGRARCKLCREPIAKGELRYGVTEDSYQFDGQTTAWHHAVCAAMRRATGFLRALAAAEVPIPPAHRASYQAIAETTRAHRIKDVVWRHANEPRCVLELSGDRFALFTIHGGKQLTAEGTLDEVVASVPDDDLEEVVDTITASGRALGREAPPTKPARPRSRNGGKKAPKPAAVTVRVRFELVSGAMTYAEELVLDEAKCTVTRRSESGADGALTPSGKPSKHKLATVELARKYLRYRVATHPWTQVAGDRVELIDGEDFKDVKDKSPDYRYLEHAATGRFWDIDRDVSVVTIWEGAIGTNGDVTEHEHRWDGEARDFYKQQLSEREAAGFVEPPGHAARRATGKR